MGTDTQSDDKRQRTSWWPIFAIWSLVLASWCLFGWLSIKQEFVEDAGTFGDMFGAANALFSGLAFGTLIYTVFLQRQELALQRLELRETRRELAGQREQMESQSNQMRTDAFESSFFRVLSVLEGIVNSMDLVGGHPAKGRDCFGRFYVMLSSAYRSMVAANVEGLDEKICRRIYADFYKKYQGDVGHYFRTLYNLVKLVDRSKVEDKRFYTNLIRAQLSNQETLLMFYNCACGLGEEKFKPLVERYALLKNMPKERLLAPEHADWFAGSAYGS